MKNIIQTKLTKAEQVVIDNLIEQLEEALAGKLVSLSREERAQYGSINEQNKLLVNKVRDYQESDSALSSPDIDWGEFESDYQSRLFYESRGMRPSKLTYGMESTKMMHDYDNYQDGLREYSYTKYKDDAGEIGYTQKAEDLKQFFPRSKPGETPSNQDENNPPT